MGGGTDADTAILDAPEDPVGSIAARTVAPAPRPPPSHASSTTVGSPLEALERDEMMRTRWFCAVACAISIAGGVSVLILPGDPTATLLVLASFGVAMVAIGFMLHRTRNPLEFRRPSTVLGWFVPAVCVTSAIPYFGVFSPMPVVLVLGIYFLCTSSRLAIPVYGTLAGVHGLVAILVLSGLTRDTGLVQPMPLGLRDQIIVQGLVQLVMLGTFVTARFSRRTALGAVGELERAVRVAAHREALLLEAREAVERALASGRGRFSEQTIGSYHLGTVIGRGAMGEVYEATDERTQGRVAIKLLSETSLSNPNHVLRFLRELRTAAGIESPHVVKVLDVGEHPVPYLVMERLEGMTLGEILRKRSLSPIEVIELVTQIGAGITAAAAAAIVHRDLKPQNLFFHGGTWKILDFGVARALDSGDSLTAGQVVGTPSYMAPEQASGGTVDHYTDLYALAAIAYRALTGHPPFAAGEIAETLYRVVHTRPRRPTELVPSLASDVDLALAIGLAKRPSERFGAAADFAGALVDALEGRLSSTLRSRGDAMVSNGAWARSTRAVTSRL